MSRIETSEITSIVKKNQPSPTKSTTHPSNEFSFVLKRVSIGNKFIEGNKRKKTKNRIISNKEMIKVLHLSQQQASKQLGCSLSTLKRRFYELKDGLGLNCWPTYFHEIRHLPIFQKIYPMSLQFILND